MDEVQLSNMIANIIAGGASNIGEIMKTLKEDARAEDFDFDGKKASQIAREKLNG